VLEAMYWIPWLLNKGKLNAQIQFHTKMPQIENTAFLYAFCGQVQFRQECSNRDKRFSDILVPTSMASFVAKLHCSKNLVQIKICENLVHL
jgi:hypothetical protein